MKIKISKTLLFTSLVAVALLGATQPVSASAAEASNSIYNTYSSGYDYDVYIAGYKEGFSGAPAPTSEEMKDWPYDYQLPYIDGYIKGKNDRNTSKSESSESNIRQGENFTQPPQIPAPSSPSIPKVPNTKWPDRKNDFSELSFGKPPKLFESSSEWGQAVY
uniref:GSIC TK01 n=1 Tax=Streptococcus dysgalactiae subsp. equisimilis TaxID=119602 RepID=D2YZL7_STREQ|nr:GSIC TK01 [Streptococcus dysgalactiae subsp. equisimilis]